MDGHPQWLKNVSHIVWDLDGTLYAGDEHYREFARRFSAWVDPDLRPEFLTECEAILAGRHELRPGRVVEFHRGLWREDAAGRQGPLPVRKRLVLPAQPEVPVVLADPWAAIRTLARGYGVDPETTGISFADCRLLLMEDGFPLGPVPGLREEIERLSDRVKMALVSNATAQHTETTLRRLGLAGRFDPVRPEAGKPQGLEQVLADWFVGDPHATGLVGIGDKYDLDLAPVRAVGGHTIQINPWHVEGTGADLLLRDHGRLVELLRHVAP